MCKKYLLCILIISIIFTSYASHLSIVQKRIEKSSQNTAKVTFSVKWDDSWNNDINNDGVWVFGKFQDNKGLWMPMTLSESSNAEYGETNTTLAEGFSSGKVVYGPELNMWIPDTKLGFFLYPIEDKGDVYSKEVSFIWNIPDNYSFSSIDNVEYNIYGIEMVYVPEDKHYVGDPNGTDGPLNCFYTYPDQGAYLIDSEKEIEVKKENGFLFFDQDNDRSRDEVPFIIPETFNKGYKAFWLMKYEMSSKQYVDFLNTLTREQQNPRTLTDITTENIENYHVLTNTAEEYLRQSIVCQKKGNTLGEPVEFFTYAPERACNAICWGDVCAFGDWAGLRPQTELEYEKACRGPLEAQPDELAWGTQNIGRADFFSGADGCGDELKVPVSGVVNCCYGGGIAPFLRETQKEPDNPGFEGPVTCGLFANSQHEGVSKRENDGSSYYGIMELSGNVWEPCVTVGHPKGREYLGTHGDGIIDEKGYGNVPDWPDSTGAGAGVRGGVWVSPEAKYLVISLRFAAAHTKSTRRFNGGCRLAF